MAAAGRHPLAQQRTLAAGGKSGGGTRPCPPTCAAAQQASPRAWADVACNLGAWEQAHATTGLRCREHTPGWQPLLCVCAGWAVRVCRDAGWIGCWVAGLLRPSGCPKVWPKGPSFPEVLSQSSVGSWNLDSLRGGTSGRAARKDRENGQKRKHPSKRLGMPRRFLNHLKNPAG
jgi:hypothetical protein